MPIDAGDVVLTFLGDTTDLDKAFDKVADQAEGAKDDLSPVQDAVGGIGDKFKNVGTAAEGAGAATTAASGEITTGATAAAGAIGGVETATLGAAAATGKLTAGAVEAEGSISAMSAVAGSLELALVGAFAVGTVLLFIEALVLGVSELDVFRGMAHELDLAWNDFQSTALRSLAALDEKLLQAGIKADELRGDHLAALNKELELIDHQSMKELESEFKILAKAADEVFAQLQTHWFSVVADSTGAKDALTEFKNQYDLLIAEGKKKEASDLLAGTLNSAQKTLETLQETKKVADAAAIDAANAGKNISGFPIAGPSDQQIRAQQVLVGALQTQVAAETKINELAKDNATIFAAKDQSKVAADAAKAATDQIAQAKAVEAAQLASIEKVKAEQLQAYNDGKISAGELAAAEIKSSTDARLAHQTYLTTVVDAYTKAGLGAKAYAAQQDLNLQKTKDAVKLEEDYGKLQTQLAANEAKYKTLAAESWKATYEEINKATFAEELLAKVDPFTPQIKKVLDLNNALRQVGVQGFLPLNQQLAATQKAEKLLNDAGIHDGQIWLQVQAAKLKAIIALDAAEGKSSKATIKELQDVEKELKKYGTSTKDAQKTFDQMMVDMNKSMGDFALAIGDALASVLTGQQSFGEAMIQATAQMVGKLASMWAEYFAAKAVADIWLNPGMAAAEFTAAVALEALSGVLGSVGQSNSGGSSKTDWTGGTGSSTTNNNGPATQAQTQPTGGQNVPHLAAGGLITGPTLAVVGDSRSGGRASEAVIPLDDPEAMGRIAATIAGHLGGQTGNTTHIHVDGMISADNMSKVVKQMDRQIAKRQSRLTAGNSFRLTRRG